MPANNCSSAQGPVAPSGPGPRSPLLSTFLPALSAAVLALVLVSCGSRQASDSISIVQAAFDRLAAADVDGYLAYYAEDVINLDPQCHRYGLDTLREDLAYAVAHEHRWEIRDLESNGNVVTFTIEDFFRETSHATYSDAADVVVDGKIIFDGWESCLLAECERDPSQAFCIGD